MKVTRFGPPWFRITGALELSVTDEDCGSTLIYHLQAGALETNIDELPLNLPGDGQKIPTKGAIDFEYFTIRGDHYLAVANHYDSETSSYETQSLIYKWENENFIPLQDDITTQGAYDWEAFTIDSKYYLAVANCRNKSGKGIINPVIYKWNGTGFDFFQNIQTNWAEDLEFFSQGTDYYLAVANGGGSESKHLKWKDGKFDAENPYQLIPSKTGMDWQAFRIGDYHYMALANYRDFPDNYEVDSKIFRWDGTHLVEIQSIPTIGTYDMETFTIGTKTYLIAANSYNDEGEEDEEKYRQESVLYSWDGSSFREEPRFTTDSARDFTAFLL